MGSAVAVVVVVVVVVAAAAGYPAQATIGRLRIAIGTEWLREPAPTDSAMSFRLQNLTAIRPSVPAAAVVVDPDPVTARRIVRYRAEEMTLGRKETASGRPARRLLD